ncbi:MAG: aminotransferase class I/II-fold pyridoxal phosphate-dependent enzyme [Pseudomonadota bacterium]
MAHLGLFPVLAFGEMPSFPIVGRGFVFLIDKTAHSSIQINRGLLEQFGKVVIVDCKDQQHLEDTLKCLDYQFPPRLILVNSLAKGFGVLGGVLLFKNKEDADFIKRFAPTYVFSGPLALSVVNAAVASAKIHLSEEIHHIQTALWDNVNYFDSLLVKNCIKADSSVPFRGILVGDELKAIEYTKKLKRRGFAVTAAMYPTVAKNQSLLRIAISAAHSKQDISLLCRNIKEIL